MKLKHPALYCQSLKLDDELFELKINEDNIPIVQHGSTHYKDIYKLTIDFPLLTKGRNIEVLSQLANFLFQGTSYKFINNISEYKESYLNRIEFEKNSLDFLPERLIDHGIFDLNSMHPPVINGKELTFYVYDDHTGVPYKVTCPFPIPANVKAVYSLLPYSES